MVQAGDTIRRASQATTGESFLEGIVKMSELEFHPIANLFPLMQGQEFDALVLDIKTNGLREAITLLDDKILDGRNRYRACVAAGVEPIFRQYDGNGSPLAFVISLNLHRRHLDESQRGMVAAKVATLRDGERQVGKFAEVPTQPEAAKMLNVSERTTRSARKVLDHGTPEMIAAVEQAKIAVSVAASFSHKEPEMQRKLVDKIVREKMKPSYALRCCKSEEARQSAAEFFKGPAPEIDGRAVKILKKPNEPRWELVLGPNAAGLALPSNLEALKAEECYVEWQRKIEAMETEAKRLRALADKMERDARDERHILTEALMDECQRIHGRAIPYTRTIEYEVLPEFNEQLMALKAEAIAKLLLAGPEQATIMSEGVWSDCAYWFLPMDKIPGKRASNCWTGCGNEL
jgi:ParB-like chromosome segregation protein Spo0J